MLSRYVPKLYAFTANSPTADQTLSLKLDKLIGVWEGHKYFDDNCYKVGIAHGGIIDFTASLLAAAESKCNHDRRAGHCSRRAAEI